MPTAKTTENTNCSTIPPTSASWSSSSMTVSASAAAEQKLKDDSTNCPTTSIGDGRSTNDDNSAQKDKVSEIEGRKVDQQKIDSAKKKLEILARKGKPKASTKPITEQTYWDSTEAKKLFNTSDDEEDAKVSVERRLVKLKKAMEKPTSYLDLVDIKPEYVHLLKDNEIETIKNRIMYLSVLLQLALDNMNIKKTWKQCCEETVKYMRNHYTLVGGNFGFTPLASTSSLQKLHNSFRKDDKIVLASDGALFEKRIQKHLEKKSKLEKKHRKWLQRGWTRNRKLRKLEEKLDSIKQEQKRKDEKDDEEDEDDSDEDSEEGDYLTAREYELMMRY